MAFSFDKAVKTKEGAFVAYYGDSMPFFIDALLNNIKEFGMDFDEVATAIKIYHQNEGDPQKMWDTATEDEMDDLFFSALRDSIDMDIEFKEEEIADLEIRVQQCEMLDEEVEEDYDESFRQSIVKDYGYRNDDVCTCGDCKAPENCTGKHFGDFIEDENGSLPNTLYHGTLLKNLLPIMQEGLHPMNRDYVSLFLNPETAERIASRHLSQDNDEEEAVIVLKIDLAQIKKDGDAVGYDLPTIKPSKYGVLYAVEYVHPKYITVYH